jgi:hypothetical protein
VRSRQLRSSLWKFSASTCKLFACTKKLCARPGNCARVSEICEGFFGISAIVPKNCAEVHGIISMFQKIVLAVEKIVHAFLEFVLGFQKIYFTFFKIL